MQKNRARSLRCNRISYWGKEPRKRREDAAHLLGKFGPFPNSGGSIRVRAPFAKEKRRKEGLDPTFRLEGKDKSITLKSKKIPKPGFFFFFPKCVRAGQRLIPEGVSAEVLHPFPRGTLGKVRDRVDKAGQSEETGGGADELFD